MKQVKVVFVCLGNICRSPLAEVVVSDQAAKRGMDGSFHFASAGTGSWHIGNSADHRAIQVARSHGLDLSSHRAQQITATNAEQWDWFVVMDANNYADLLRMGVSEERLLLMRQFEPGFDTIPDVPDPYYDGGQDGFEAAYQMLRENADRLLDHLEGNAL